MFRKGETDKVSLEERTPASGQEQPTKMSRLEKIALEKMENGKQIEAEGTVCISAS